MRSPWFSGDYPITQPYGCTGYAAEGPNPHHPECPYFHDGIDLGLPCDTRIYMVGQGSVRQIGVYGGGPYALIINIGQYDVWLLHLARNFVNVGDSVFDGMPLADSDNLGFSTGCHLHFEVTTAGGGYRDSVDPSAWLQGNGSGPSGCGAQAAALCLVPILTTAAIELAKRVIA